MTDISERQAVEIAVAACRKKLKPEYFRLCEEKPNGIYLPSPEQPCWYVYAPWGDHLEGVIQSSRIIVLEEHRRDPF